MSSFFVKLVGGQIFDQYFMLACLSAWIYDKLIVMNTDKKSAEELMES